MSIRPRSQEVPGTLACEHTDILAGLAIRERRQPVAGGQRIIELAGQR